MEIEEWESAGALPLLYGELKQLGLASNAAKVPAPIDESPRPADRERRARLRLPAADVCEATVGKFARIVGVRARWGCDYVLAHLS